MSPSLLLLLISESFSLFGNGHILTRKSTKDFMINEGLFEGDIISKVHVKGRMFISYPEMKWPNHTIPYKIDESLAANESIIMQAVQQYHEFTCLKFVPVKSSDKNFLILQDGRGCSSYVGMLDTKAEGQPIHLNRTGCISVGIIVHELGHAIGLYHEHSRPDNYKYIKVNDHNLKKGAITDFEVPETIVLYDKYSYDSIMHYGNKAFSKNGQNTIEAYNGQPLFAVHQKPGLTLRDVMRINTFYDCPDTLYHPRYHPE